MEECPHQLHQRGEITLRRCGNVVDTAKRATAAVEVAQMGERAPVLFSSTVREILSIANSVRLIYGVGQRLIESNTRVTLAMSRKEQELITKTISSGEEGNSTRQNLLS